MTTQASCFRFDRRQKQNHHERNSAEEQSQKESARRRAVFIPAKIDAANAAPNHKMRTRMMMVFPSKRYPLATWDIERCSDSHSLQVARGRGDHAPAQSSQG